MTELLTIAPEVEDALADRRPVVALESTIIAHGLPWPQNLETAQALEQAVRDHGATPATIAVIDGQPQIGLDEASLRMVADPEAEFRKASTRDLAALRISLQHGATTVAATMRLAHLAGIRVFATGGIGGVHRGWTEDMDVSADIYELARTPVAVVCAGAKTILDVPTTLELLESLGVPVIGYRCDLFPGFYARETESSVQTRVETTGEAAAIFAVHRMIAADCGVVVAVPPPADSALPREEVEGWIAAALRNARDDGITGKASTPYLLKRIVELSEGRSLAANVALARHNAGIAAELATAVSALGLR
ncbi:MAG: pseudouridine-5'-phosphate glycosidase [Alphaproteobacteria bacterium]